MAKRKVQAAWPLVCVLAVALILRIIHLYQSEKSPFFEPLLLDPKFYHEWALRILRGDPQGVFYGLPLYPYFLAALYKASGLSVMAVKWAQILLGLVTVFLTYAIGRKLFDERAAFWAALLAALYGPLVFHETIFIPETLAVPLYGAAFLAVLKLSEKPKLWTAVLAGVLCGLAALTKAGIFLFVLLYPVYFLWKDRSGARIKTAGVFWLCFLAVLSPVVVHNRIMGKDSVFLTSHAGFNFYVGNHPGAEGVFHAPEGTGTNVEAQREDSSALAEAALGRKLKPSEVSRYWSGKAWTYIRENPADFLKLSLRKLALFFDARELSDVEDYQFQKNFVPLLRSPLPNFALLGPFFFTGLFFAWLGRRNRLPYLWTACYLAGMIAFFVNARYRLPMLTVFFPVAAWGGLCAFDSWKQRRWKELVLALLAFGAGSGLSQMRLVNTDFSRDFVNAGDAYAEKNRFDEAMPFYRRALEIRPDHAKANLGMGVLLTRMGRDDEAASFYRKTLELEPRNAQAWNNLGMWHEAKGDLKEAQRHFLKALELKPGNSQAHNNLGLVYGKRGDYAQAASEFEASLAFNPSSVRATTNLGLMRWHLGQRQEAERLWRHALELDPKFPEALKAIRLLESFDSQ